MSDEWWDQVTSADTAGVPINRLLPELHQVTGQEIPYGLLPRRVRTVYSGEFTHWSDVADETIASLGARPRAGMVTVRALLEAARDAVSAAGSHAAVDAPTALRHLLSRLAERERLILSARVWGLRRQSQPVVAQRLGVHVASVRRNQVRAEARLAALLADPAHRQVSDHAEALRRQLGTFVPKDTATEKLSKLGLCVDTDEAQLLLFVAGPYESHDAWLEDTATGGAKAVAAAVNQVFAECAAPTTSTLVVALDRLGVPNDSALRYLSGQLHLRRFGDVWVRWGEGTADKVAAALQVLNRPATPDEIADVVDLGAHARRVREALFADSRFVRASRQTWALRDWETAEYGGIAEEVGRFLDSSGGILTIDSVVDHVRSSFPDVAESSIRSTLNTLAFVTEQGSARRRAASDPWPPTGPLAAVRGAFRTGDNEIRCSIAVSTEVLRGSGRPIHPAVAAALGVAPGEKRAFGSPWGQVVVSWRLTSTNGPSVSSLRPLARAAGAQIDDVLLLVFDLQHRSMDAIRVGTDLRGLERVRVLLGRRVRRPAAALASCLGCRTDEVVALLRERGDWDLADLAEEPGGRA